MCRAEVDGLPNSNMQRTYQIVVVQSKLLGLLLPAEDLTVFVFFLIFIQTLCTWIFENYLTDFYLFPQMIWLVGSFKFSCRLFRYRFTTAFIKFQDLFVQRWSQKLFSTMLPTITMQAFSDSVDPKVLKLRLSDKY